MTPEEHIRAMRLIVDGMAEDGHLVEFEPSVRADAIEYAITYLEEWFKEKQ
jgi:hypothetical protein